MDIPSEVFKAYGFDQSKITLTPLGQGLINQTWKLHDGNAAFVLQKINEHVFPDARPIAHNIRLVQDYLHTHQPGYFFVAPIHTLSGAPMVMVNEYNYRLFPFVPDAHSHQVVTNEKQAYEAARQFGLFTRMLAGIDVDKLKTTIEGFHDLALRFSQFAESEKVADEGRLLNASKTIQAIYIHAEIVSDFKAITEYKNFLLRPTHHDTKISNVLFDSTDKALCVIDFDTLMPGYFISDVGDMMRTYLCPVSEEETDLDKVEINPAYFNAIMQGYLGEMKAILSKEEIDRFVYSGKFMIYMQALRFLTDYLNHDIYYGANYEDHNLQRARNQMQLLESYIAWEDRFQKMVNDFINH